MIGRVMCEDVEENLEKWYKSTLKTNISNEGVRIESICDCVFVENLAFCIWLNMSAKGPERSKQEWIPQDMICFWYKTCP